MDKPDLDGADWHRSSLSTGDESSIEVATVTGAKENSERVIAMRDSKNRQGPTLIFTPDEWAAFTAGVRDGEFDLG